MHRELLVPEPDLTRRLQSLLGRESDSMVDIEQRARALVPDRRTIAWEGDASNFQFSFVSQSAAALLGYPPERWTREATFWADTVVHPEDRAEAIAFCALATAQCRDHDFVYRAVAVDGRTVWLHDIVKVIRGPKGLPERLRGVMIDVTDRLEGAGPPG